MLRYDLCCYTLSQKNTDIYSITFDTLQLGCVMGDRRPRTAGLKSFQPRPRSGVGNPWRTLFADLQRDHLPGQDTLPTIPTNNNANKSPLCGNSAFAVEGLLQCLPMLGELTGSPQRSTFLYALMSSTISRRLKAGPSPPPPMIVWSMTTKMGLALIFQESYGYIYEPR